MKKVFKGGGGKKARLNPEKGKKNFRVASLILEEPF
jgi:hypothetical protein